jgi:hypothetical protein
MAPDAWMWTMADHIEVRDLRPDEVPAAVSLLARGVMRQGVGRV